MSGRSGGYKAFWRRLWPRRDRQLWQVTAAPHVRTRIIVAVLLAPLIGFLELLAYALVEESAETRSSVFMPTAIIGLVAGAILLVVGGLSVRGLLARRRGALFVAIAGTLLYGLILVLATPFSAWLLLLYWPVSIGFGALYALNLYALLRLLLYPYRDRFWSRAGALAPQVD